MENTRLDELYRLFPRLGLEDQRYVLGVTEGLTYAQARLDRPRPPDPPRQPLLRWREGQRS